MVYPKNHDKRWNKAWYFFMLVAAGLILSWGQVGQRYKQTAPVDTREYLLLRTEPDCDLLAGPCAAFAPDYAIVIKLERHAGWQTLYVRTANESLSEQSLLKLSFEPESSLYEPEVLPVRFKQPDTWYSDMQLPRNDKTIWKLRVKIERGEKVMVADYPVPEL